MRLFIHISLLLRNHVTFILIEIALCRLVLPWTRAYFSRSVTLLLCFWDNCIFRTVSGLWFRLPISGRTHSVTSLIDVFGFFSLLTKFKWFRFTLLYFFYLVLTWSRKSSQFSFFGIIFIYAGPSKHYILWTSCLWAKILNWIIRSRSCDRLLLGQIATTFGWSGYHPWRLFLLLIIQIRVPLCVNNPLLLLHHSSVLLFKLVDLKFPKRIHTVVKNHTLLNLGINFLIIYWNTKVVNLRFVPLGAQLVHQQTVVVNNSLGHWLVLQVLVRIVCG